jgi:shikimate kinase
MQSQLYAPIFLIGYMGVGKTTLGKQLANKLNYTFIDTDTWIEQKMQLSIPEIFAKFGEHYFRELEKEAVQQLPKEKIVVATGGGLPCYGNLMSTILDSGISIYLHRPAKELVQRLVNAKSNRPLIQHKSEAELLAFITDQLHEREVFYTQANITLTRESQQVSDVIAAIDGLTYQ